MLEPTQQLIALAAHSCVLDGTGTFDRDSCRTWMAKVIDKQHDLLPWSEILNGSNFEARDRDTNNKVYKRMTFGDGSPGGDLFRFFLWAVESEGSVVKARLKTLHDHFTSFDDAIESSKSNTNLAADLSSFPASAGIARTWASKVLSARPEIKRRLLDEKGEGVRLFKARTVSRMNYPRDFRLLYLWLSFVEPIPNASEAASSKAAVAAPTKLSQLTKAAILTALAIEVRCARTAGTAGAAGTAPASEFALPGTKEAARTCSSKLLKKYGLTKSGLPTSQPDLSKIQTAGKRVFRTEVKSVRNLEYPDEFKLLLSWLAERFQNSNSSDNTATESNNAGALAGAPEGFESALAADEQRAFVQKADSFVAALLDASGGGQTHASGSQAQALLADCGFQADVSPNEVSGCTGTSTSTSTSTDTGTDSGTSANTETVSSDKDSAAQSKQNVFDECVGDDDTMVGHAGSRRKLVPDSAEDRTKEKRRKEELQKQQQSHRTPDDVMDEAQVPAPRASAPPLPVPPLIPAKVPLAEPIPEAATSVFTERSREDLQQPLLRSGGDTIRGGHTYNCWNCVNSCNNLRVTLTCYNSVPLWAVLLTAAIVLVAAAIVCWLYLISSSRQPAMTRFPTQAPTSNPSSAPTTLSQLLSCPPGFHEWTSTRCEPSPPVAPGNTYMPPQCTNGGCCVPGYVANTRGFYGDHKSPWPGSYYAGHNQTNNRYYFCEPDSPIDRCPDTRGQYLLQISNCPTGSATDPNCGICCPPQTLPNGSRYVGESSGWWPPYTTRHGFCVPRGAPHSGSSAPMPAAQCNLTGVWWWENKTKGGRMRWQAAVFANADSGSESDLGVITVRPSPEEARRAASDGVTLLYGTLRGVFRSDWRFDAVFNATGQYTSCVVDGNCTVMRCDSKFHGPWQFPAIYQRREPPPLAMTAAPPQQQAAHLLRGSEA